MKQRSGSGTIISRLSLASGSISSPAKTELVASADCAEALDITDDLQNLLNGREPGDLDFYSITMDGSCSDGELLEQIRNVSRQKGELQQREIELRAQMMAMEIQRNFESRSAEYENAAAGMQLCQRIWKRTDTRTLRMLISLQWLLR